MKRIPESNVARTICASVLLSFVIACSNEPGSPPVTPPPQKTVPAATAPAVASQPTVPVVEPQKYVYEVGNRRDPFAPVVSESSGDSGNGSDGLGGVVTPLQQYEIDQFRVVGVIVGKGQPAAMVVAPDGKGYVLRKGLKIGKNNGTVVVITSVAVVIEEQSQDSSGNVLKNQVELKLTKREGAK